MTSFTAETYQNEYLPIDGSEVNAVVTVAATGNAPEGSSTNTQMAEILILDMSGSMGAPRDRRRDAGRQGQPRGRWPSGLASARQGDLD